MNTKVFNFYLPLCSYRARNLQMPNFCLLSLLLSLRNRSGTMIQAQWPAGPVNEVSKHPQAIQRPLSSSSNLPGRGRRVAFESGKAVLSFYPLPSFSIDFKFCGKIPFMNKTVNLPSCKQLIDLFTICSLNKVSIFGRKKLCVV